MGRRAQLPKGANPYRAFRQGRGGQRFEARPSLSRKRPMSKWSIRADIAHPGASLMNLGSWQLRFRFLRDVSLSPVPHRTHPASDRRCPRSSTHGKLHTGSVYSPKNTFESSPCRGTASASDGRASHCQLRHMSPLGPTPCSCGAWDTERRHGKSPSLRRRAPPSGVADWLAAQRSHVGDRSSQSSREACAYRAWAGDVHRAGPGLLTRAMMPLHMPTSPNSRRRRLPRSRSSARPAFRVRRVRDRSWQAHASRAGRRGAPRLPDAGGGHTMQDRRELSNLYA
ncbi:hypothetical protein K466DRAFT_370467 [Polyporus arcularius HHB13444]|uniref:Uncharacterized protein n=1 Tax=Polyporus arcularius HHB13444 TaxID=1314778 RepID=A0A5C3PLI5_9APHY|nr:hypothetical protein K466DRAFT_370467 [Polyporus arcularius HHB13444]